MNSDQRPDPIIAEIEQHPSGPLQPLGRTRVTAAGYGIAEGSGSRSRRSAEGQERGVVRRSDPSPTGAKVLSRQTARRSPRSSDRRRLLSGAGAKPNVEPAPSQTTAPQPAALAGGRYQVRELLARPPSADDPARKRARAPEPRHPDGGPHARGPRARRRRRRTGIRRVVDTAAGGGQREARGTRGPLRVGGRRYGR